jgi:hypothetical protein
VMVMMVHMREIGIDITISLDLRLLWVIKVMHILTTMMAVVLMFSRF